jgi:hypothetical protein
MSASVRNAGAWKCIQAQLVTMSPENYPADETIERRYIKGRLQERAMRILSQLNRLG